MSDIIFVLLIMSYITYFYADRWKNYSDAFGYVLWCVMDALATVSLSWLTLLLGILLIGALV